MTRSLRGEMEKDPYLSEVIQDREEQTRKRQETEQRYQEIARQAAEREELLRRKLEEAMIEYSPMVKEVLSELRDTLYPRLILTSEQPTGFEHKQYSTHGSKLVESLGFEKKNTTYYGKGSNSTHDFTFVPVFLICFNSDDNGEVISFNCAYKSGGLSRNNTHKAWDRQRTAALIKESLIQAIIEILQPNSVLEMGVQYRSALEEIVEQVAKSNECRTLAEYLFQRFVHVGSYHRPRGARVSVDPERVNTQGKSVNLAYDFKDRGELNAYLNRFVWKIRYTTSSELRYDQYDAEYWKETYADIVTVRLIFDSEHQPTHFECQCTDGQGGFITRDVPPSTELVMEVIMDMINQTLGTLSSSETKKRKKILGIF